MAWTSPKTWLSAILSSSDLNTHVRDNLLYLAGTTGFLDLPVKLRSTGSSGPATGTGLEVGWSGTAGFVQAVNAATSALQPLQLYGSSMVLFQGGISRIGIDGSGNVTINSIPFPLTTSSANLGSNTALGAQNNATDLVSISLAAGTWWVSGGVTVLDSAVAADFSARIWDGTNTITSGQASSRGAASNACISLSGYITLVGTTTVKLTCQDDTAGTGTAQATTPGGSYPNATWIRAMRIG